MGVKSFIDILLLCYQYQEIKSTYIDREILTPPPRFFFGLFCTGQRTSPVVFGIRILSLLDSQEGSWYMLQKKQGASSDHPSGKISSTIVDLCRYGHIASSASQMKAVLFLPLLNRNIGFC